MARLLGRTRWWETHHLLPEHPVEHDGDRKRNWIEQADECLDDVDGLRADVEPVPTPDNTYDCHQDTSISFDVGLRLIYILPGAGAASRRTGAQSPRR